MKINKNGIKGQIRHGDLLFEKVKNPCTNNMKHEIAKGKLVVAEGEATNHFHAFEIDEADWWKGEQNRTTGVEQVFNLKKEAEIDHPEHGLVPFKEGTYQVIREREFDEVEEFRRVAD